MNIKSLTYCFLSMLWVSYAPTHIALQASRYFPKEKASEQSSKLNIRAEEDIILDEMFKREKKEGLKKLIEGVKEYILDNKDERIMEPFKNLTPQQYMYLRNIWHAWKYKRKLNSKFVWKGNSKLWTMSTIIDIYILPLIYLFQTKSSQKIKVLTMKPMINLVLSERLLGYVANYFPTFKMQLSNVEKPFLVKTTCPEKAIQWGLQNCILIMKQKNKTVAFPTLVTWVLTKPYIMYEKERQKKFQAINWLAQKKLLSKEQEIYTKNSYVSFSKSETISRLTEVYLAHEGMPKEKELFYDFTMELVRIPNFFERKTMNEMLIIPTDLSALNTKSKYCPALTFYDKPIVRLSMISAWKKNKLGSVTLLFTFFNGHPDYQSLFIQVNLKENLVIPIYGHLKKAWAKSALRRKIPTSKLIKPEQERGFCFFPSDTPEYIYLMKGIFDEYFQNQPTFSKGDSNNTTHRPLIDEVIELKEGEDNNNNHPIVPLPTKNTFKEYLKALWLNAILEDIESNAGFAQATPSTKKKEKKKKKGKKSERAVGSPKKHQANNKNHDHKQQEKEWIKIGKEFTEKMIEKIQKADRSRMKSMYLLGTKFVKDGDKSIKIISKPTKNGYQFAIQFVDKVNDQYEERTIGIHRLHGGKGAIDKKKAHFKNLMQDTVTAGIEAIQQKMDHITYHCSDSLVE